MIEIKCDICNERVKNFKFYKLEETICQINGENIKEANDNSYEAPFLYSRIHLCETCLNKINERITSLRGSRVDYLF